MHARIWNSLSTIRVRLTAALAAALLPVLLLGGLQSTIAFRRESAEVREDLAAAAERSAVTARTRIEAANVLLTTLAPGARGQACAARLAEVSGLIAGYANLVRLDAAGRAVCSAAPLSGEAADVGAQPWFQQLARGDEIAVIRQAPGRYARQSAILTVVRAEGPGGRFDGAMAAVIPLESLTAPTIDRSLPRGAEVALTDTAGGYLTATRADAFPPLPRDWRAKAGADGSLAWYARDPSGERRLYSAARLVGDDLYVLLSAPSRGLISWDTFNPLTGLALPILTFLLSLVTVSMVTERVVTRWIAYLQRVATLYARGRFSVRPVQAEHAPPEIRHLAETLEHMADAIVGRDATLRDNLAQKDALMREIHHRVKNNLQVISSLLNMQQRALTDPAARAAMSDTRQRITALALIYRALYQGPDLKKVDLRPFLEELTAQLIAGDALHGAPVRTELHVDALVIDPDRLAPFALFAVEAITNAQKHAFAERGGSLTVDFTVRGDEAELAISDDGQASDEALGGTGVGRTLMTAFARQLRGRAELSRNAQGGVTARLIFPTPTPESLSPAASAHGNQAAA
jgi:two-component sensor histidine kinase